MSRGATVVATRHTRKGGAPIAVHAGMASVAFSAVARSELFFAKDPDGPEDSGQFILAHAKCNVGPQQRSLRYRAEEVEVDGLDGETYPRIEWLGQSHYTADQLASGEAADGGQAQREAERWLQEWLREHGPAHPREVMPEAREAGHTRRTLERAMDSSLFIRGDEVPLHPQADSQGAERTWQTGDHRVVVEHSVREVSIPGTEKVLHCEEIGRLHPFCRIERGKQLACDRC